METPANTRKGRSAKNEMTTPANTRAPPNKGRTPMITPKFDTSQALSRTVSRVARKNEVLVSLSGSPVVGVTAKATKAEESKVLVIQTIQKRLPLILCFLLINQREHTNSAICFCWISGINLLDRYINVSIPMHQQSPTKLT